MGRNRVEAEEACRSVIGEKQGKKFRFVTVIAASEKRAPIVRTLRSTTPGALTVNVSTHRTSETITIGAREVVFSAGGRDGRRQRTCILTFNITVPHH